MADIVEQWLDAARSDVDLYVRKRAEYGQADLLVMGHALSLMLKMDEDAGVEAAIGFYLLGKVARMVGAWERGRRPSDDTIRDLVVYANMLRMQREGVL